MKMVYNVMGARPSDISPASQLLRRLRLEDCKLKDFVANGINSKPALAT